MRSLGIRRSMSPAFVASIRGREPVALVGAGLGPLVTGGTDELRGFGLDEFLPAHIPYRTRDGQDDCVRDRGAGRGLATPAARLAFDAPGPIDTSINDRELRVATTSDGVRGNVRDPLLPITVIVTAICTVVAVWLALLAYAQISLGGAFGWGSGIICSTNPSAHLSPGGAGLGEFVHAQPDVEVGFVPQYCDFASEGTTRLLSTLTVLPSFVLYLGGLLMLFRVVHTARRAGAFTLRTVRQLRLFGWYLIVGSVMCHIVEGAAGDALLSSFTTTTVVWDFTDDFPGFPVLTGIGLIALARIIRLGTP